MCTSERVLADVTAAGRANPLNVLVSQAQDANTYEPTARLELGKTYYWRVDEVGATPGSIVQGLRLEFHDRTVHLPR